MTPEQKAAYVSSQTACMLAELEAMKMANADCEKLGLPRSFKETDFHDLGARFGITHNQVLELFHREW